MKSDKHIDLRLPNGNTSIKLCLPGPADTRPFVRYKAQSTVDMSVLLVGLCVQTPLRNMQPAGHELPLT